MNMQLYLRKAKQNQAHAHYPALNQLVTDQEQQVNEAKTAKNPLSQLRSIEKPLQCYADEEEEVEVSMEQLKQSDAEKMSVLVGQLLAKNKISAKNAFEVPLIHLHETFAFVESSSDNSWKRLSSSLESNNKIYAYRVDATHTETYRMLEVISRQEKKNSEEGRNAVGVKLEKSQELLSDSSEYDSSKKHPDFLEKNYRNINIVQLDTFFNVNPVLEKTKRIFDQNGTKTLLLNCLDISRNLSLTITLLQQQDLETIAEQQWQSIDSDTIWMGLLAGDNIFRQIQGICVANNLLGEEDQALKHQTGEIESMWTELDGFRSRRLRNVASEGRSKMAVVNENGQVEEHQAPEFIVTGPINELTDPMPAEAQQQNTNLQTENQKTNSQIPQQQLDLPVQLLPIPISQHSQDFSVREVNTLADESQTSNTHQSESQRHARQMYSQDIVLREITEGVKEEDFSLDSKKVEKPQPKKPRKKKEFVPLAIDFLQKETIALNQRQQNLNIDKKKKKEFKALLKELRIDAYVDKNVVIDLKSKVDFRTKTLLGESCDKSSNQDLAADESRIIDVDFFSANKTKIMRNGRNVSIHDTKQSLKKLIEANPSTRISFISIYEQMIEGQFYISPALCFLTVLHLANEKGYSLQQHEGEYNYIIITH